MKIKYLCVTLFFSAVACNEQKNRVDTVSKKDDSSWMDTVRFNSNLTSEQREQVYYKRNFEENYKRIKDTTRVALRFFWWRSFHPYTVVRLENRPQVEINNSSGKRTVYTEWFATYKVDVQRLNRDCPERRGNKCYGEQRPFVWQQNVCVLPANKTPAVIAALDSIGFWQMKANYADASHTDGSNWTLQVYYHGRFQEVSTDMQTHPIKRICLRMLKLSGYKPKQDEIY